MAVNQSQIRLNDPILGGLVVGALQKDSNFIARKLLPPIFVGGKGATGKVFLEHPPSFLGDPSMSMLRAPGAEMKAINVDGPGTPVTYTCKSRSGRAPVIPLEHMRRSQLEVPQGFGDLTAQELAYLQRRSQRALAAALRVVEETDAGTLFFSTSSGWNLSTTLALQGLSGVDTTQISSPTTAKPIANLEIIRQYQRGQAHGQDPDALIVGQNWADKAKLCAEVRGLFVSVQNATGVTATQQRDIVTEAGLIAVLQTQLGIPNVAIAKAVKRTSQPGQTNAEGFAFDGESIWMGNLYGDQPDISLSGDVTMQARAAAMFVEQDVEAGMEWLYARRSFEPWVDESYDMKLLDGTLGTLVTDWIA